MFSQKLCDEACSLVIAKRKVVVEILGQLPPACAWKAFSLQVHSNERFQQHLLSKESAVEPERWCNKFEEVLGTIFYVRDLWLSALRSVCTPHFDPDYGDHQ